MAPYATLLLTLTLMGAPLSFAAGYLHPRAAKTAHSRAVEIEPAPEDRYDLQRLPVPEGSAVALAVDINNRGTVAGISTGANGAQETLLWSRSGALLRRIQFPNAFITSVAAIDDAEKISFGNWGNLVRQTAGTYDLRTGEWSTLPAIEGKPLNIGWSINNAGNAVGQACEGRFDAPVHCMLWMWDSRSKTYEFLTIPGATDPIPYALNDRGQIVGNYLQTPPFGYRSFLYDSGETQPVLPDIDASAFGLNDQGEIVVMMEVTEGELFQPVILDQDTLTFLPRWTGAFGTSWLALSERGDLAGIAYDDPMSPPYPLVARRK